MDIFCYGVVIAGAFFLVCNVAVKKSFDVVSAKIDFLSKQYILNGRDWRWRYRELDELMISYGRILFTFWKPVRSFFEGKDWLQ